jgi:iron complex outermembrane receptor protein
LLTGSEIEVTTNADCRRAEHNRERAGKSRAHVLIGAALLTAGFSSPSTIASAQSGVALPAVTVDSPTQKPKPARPMPGPARRTQAAAARQRNRDTAPAQPTPSEHAAAAAAKQYEAKLGYRQLHAVAEADIHHRASRGRG